MAAGVASVGLVGALAVTVPTSTLQMINAVANTLIVVGGNSDPHSDVEWGRIKGWGPNQNPILIDYAADVGIGIPGFPPLSFAGRDTYAGSVREGASETAEAIDEHRRNGGTVDVYALSLGTDVVGIALLQIKPKPGDGKVNVVQHGGPSFINSGIWYMAPPLIPGLRTGPVATQPVPEGVTVTNICIKGDSICGMGTNPISAVFYFLPGFDLHGKDYTSWQIGRYSPSDGSVLYTPGAANLPPNERTEKDGDAYVVHRQGRDETVQKYQDGTVTRTWEENGQTWVVIDTGVNPWVRLLRANGIPVSNEINTLLNTVVPVPEPGEKGLLSFPMGLWQGAGALIERTANDIGGKLDDINPLGKHDAARPELTPVHTFTAQADPDVDTSETAVAAKAAAEKAAAEKAAAEKADEDERAAAERQAAADKEAADAKAAEDKAAAAKAAAEAAAEIDPESTDTNTVTPLVAAQPQSAVEPEKTADPLTPSTETTEPTEKTGTDQAPGAAA